MSSRTPVQPFSTPILESKRLPSGLEVPSKCFFGALQGLWHPCKTSKSAIGSSKIKVSTFLRSKRSWTAVSQLCEPFWEPFGSNLEPLGRILEPLGRSWGDLGALLRQAWRLLGRSWALLGRSGGPLGLLGAAPRPPGELWARFWSCRGYDFGPFLLNFEVNLEALKQLLALTSEEHFQNADELQTHSKWPRSAFQLLFQGAP